MSAKPVNARAIAVTSVRDCKVEKTAEEKDYLRRYSTSSSDMVAAAGVGVSAYFAVNLAAKRWPTVGDYRTAITFLAGSLSFDASATKRRENCYLNYLALPTPSASAAREAFYARVPESDLLREAVKRVANARKNPGPLGSRALQMDVVRTYYHLRVQASMGDKKSNKGGEAVADAGTDGGAAESFDEDAYFGDAKSAESTGLDYYEHVVDERRSSDMDGARPSLGDETPLGDVVTADLELSDADRRSIDRGEASFDSHFSSRDNDDSRGRWGSSSSSRSRDSSDSARDSIDRYPHDSDDGRSRFESPQSSSRDYIESRYTSGYSSDFGRHRFDSDSHSHRSWEREGDFDDGQPSDTSKGDNNVDGRALTSYEQRRRLRRARMERREE